MIQKFITARKIDEKNRIQNCGLHVCYLEKGFVLLIKNFISKND